jgi:hypothetical protein
MGNYPWCASSDKGSSRPKIIDWVVADVHSAQSRDDERAR